MNFKSLSKEQILEYANECLSKNEINFEKNLIYFISSKGNLTLQSGNKQVVFNQNGHLVHFSKNVWGKGLIKLKNNQELLQEIIKVAKKQLSSKFPASFDISVNKNNILYKIGTSLSPNYNSSIPINAVPPVKTAAVEFIKNKITYGFHSLVEKEGEEKLQDLRKIFYEDLKLSFNEVLKDKKYYFLGSHKLSIDKNNFLCFKTHNISFKSKNKFDLLFINAPFEEETEICCDVEIIKNIYGNSKTKDYIIDETNKLLKNLSVNDFEIEKAQFLKDKLNEYNSKHFSEILFGNCNLSDVNVSFDTLNGDVTIKTPIFTAFCGTNAFNKSVHEFSFLQQYKDVVKPTKKISNLINYFFNKTKDLDFSIKFVSGEGIFYGKTILSIIYDGVTLQKTIDLGNIHENSRWKQQFSHFLTTCNSDIIAKHDEVFFEKINKVKNIANNYIYTDILKLISENETYITANAVVQSLRGLKVQLNTTLKKINNSGKYKFYTKEEIEKCIEELINAGFLKTKKHKGTYGVFYTLKVQDLYKNTLSKYLEDPKTIRRFLRKNKDFNCDFNFDKKFSNPDVKNISSYIDFINQAPKGWICLHADEVKKFFKGAPKEIKELLKMRSNFDKTSETLIKILK